MQENEFEKQVRQKMEELGFNPPESVWAQVDKEINQDRKRRRPLFWLFFLSGILLAGGTYYLATKNRLSDIAVNNTGSEKTVADPSAHLNKENQIIQDVEKTKRTETNKVKSKKTPEQNMDPENTTSGFVAKYKTNRNRTSNKTMVADNPLENHTHLSPNPAAKNSPDTGSTGLASAGNNQADSAASAMPAPTTAIKTVAKDSTSNKTSENKKKVKKIHLWEIGFTGNGGVSGVNQSLFKSANAANAGYYAAAAVPNVITGGTYPLPLLRDGFSFGIGAFVKRNLSLRVSLSGGLEYQYYSTRITTGDQVVNINSLPPALLSNSNSNVFYQYGSSHSYTNQYHLFQVPVVAGFQLNKSLKTRIIWEAGLSPSWLIGSTALQFDPTSNTLSKNNQVFNRFQLSAATAILIGLPGKNAQWQVGPQFQYGLTQLVKAGSGNSQHLIYFGLKFNFIPDKK